MKRAIAVLFILVSVGLLIFAGYRFLTGTSFSLPGRDSGTSTGQIVKPAKLAYNPNCDEAELVPGSENGGPVEENLDNGDSHSWSVTIVNPDKMTSDQTLVVVTEKLWSFDIVYAGKTMYFQSARYNGTQDQVICSAQKLSEGSGKFYIYAGPKDNVPDKWTLAEGATGAWWTEMTVWQYEKEAIDAGVAVEHFIGAQDESRTVDASGVALAHGQFWRPGYPGRVVHPQIAGGYTLTLPKGWEGTWWSYANPNQDIQARIIEASEKEVLPRDQIGTVQLLYCGPADSVPTTSFEFRGETVTWITSLDSWTCTPPPAK